MEEKTIRKKGDPIVDYDWKNDLFWVKKKGFIKGSVRIDNFVFDLDNKEKLIGVELMNASDEIFKLGEVKWKNIRKKK